MKTPVTVGITWYRLNEYEAVLRIMADRAKLPRSFTEWRMQAESAERKYRRLGHVVIRVFIDPKSFPDWCLARGLNVDEQARHRFVAEFLNPVNPDGENNAH